MFDIDFPDTDFKVAKELTETKGNLDIDELWDNWDGTAQELANMLGISPSTANNWISSKEDISTMAKQALGFDRLKKLVSDFFSHPKNSFVVKTDNSYEVYQKEGEFFKKIAATDDIKIARLIEKRNMMLPLIKKAIEFIEDELKIREIEIEHPWYQDLYNLEDCLHYVIDGKTFSEKVQAIRNEALQELKAAFSEIENKKDISEPKILIDIDKSSFMGTLFRFEAKNPVSLYKKYSGCVLTVRYEKENSYRVLPVKKDGEIWSDFTDYQGNNNVGKVFPTLNAAMSSVYYTRTKSINVWRECEYSVDDGKTWHPAAELQDILK